MAHRRLKFVVFSLLVTTAMLALVLVPSALAGASPGSSTPPGVTAAPTLHHCFLPQGVTDPVLVYDSGAQDIYVFYSNSTGGPHVAAGLWAVIVTPTCRLLGRVAIAPSSLQPSTGAAGYDPANGWVYFSYLTFPSGIRAIAHVVGINGTQLAANITDANWSFPNAMTYDPEVGGMAVIDEYNATLSFLVGPRLTRMVPISNNPRSISYSPVGNLLLITDHGNPGNSTYPYPSVEGYNSTSGARVGPIVRLTSISPGLMAYDPADNWTFVPGGVFSGNITARVLVLDGASGRDVKKLDLGMSELATSAVYSVQDNAVFVALESEGNGQPDEIVELKHLQIAHVIVLSTESFIGTNSLVYDASDRHVFLVDERSNEMFDVWP